ncbi:hypothetical protein L1987_28082 [Smallanthus sonchifolius]|uniref:Uncharacterized protein n=1 Tax=Smallanthus sonchifolius TaxID=185202 RepID=A0ACB9IDK7_9ASTR|nr:hypothetical protein L1987_28082 [Smallanthus sonchifolius]
MNMGGPGINNRRRLGFRPLRFSDLQQGRRVLEEIYGVIGYHITGGIDGTALTAIVTGATSGIGSETTRVLPWHDVPAVMAGRLREIGFWLKILFPLPVKLQFYAQTLCMTLSGRINSERDSIISSAAEALHSMKIIIRSHSMKELKKRKNFATRFSSSIHNELETTIRKLKLKDSCLRRPKNWKMQASRH